MIEEAVSGLPVIFSTEITRGITSKDDAVDINFQDVFAVGVL